LDEQTMLCETDIVLLDNNHNHIGMLYWLSTIRFSHIILTVFTVLCQGQIQ